MGQAEKIRIRKELTKLYPVAQQLALKDLKSGQWFAQHLDRVLAGFSALPDANELKKRWPDLSTDDLADKLATEAIHEAIAMTDAYEENLSRAEVRMLKEPKPDEAAKKIAGEILPLVAEVLTAIQLQVGLVFKLAAIYEKGFGEDLQGAMLEIFGHALGKWEPDKLKTEPAIAIGTRIFDRAILQNVDPELGDAQRKGFYCYYTKAVAKEAVKRVFPRLPRAEPPPPPTPPDPGKGMLTAEPAPGAADDIGFQT